MLSISLDPDQDDFKSGLICVHPVCEIYQQTTSGKELLFIEEALLFLQMYGNFNNLQTVFT